MSLKESIENTYFRIIDTETTAIEEGKIVEIASVAAYFKLDSPDFEYETFHSLVNPGVPIPPEASAIHHITDDMVMDSPPWPAIQKEFEPDPTVQFAAHNAEFDAGVMGQDPSGWLCTWRMASHLWPDAPSYGNQVLRYWLKLNVKVDSRAPGSLAHSAMADTLVTTAILHRILQEVVTRDDVPAENVGELVDWANRPIIQKKIQFGKHRGDLWSEVPYGYLAWIIKQGQDAWDRDTWATVQHYAKKKY